MPENWRTCSDQGWYRGPSREWLSKVEGNGWLGNVIVGYATDDGADQGDLSSTRNSDTRPCVYQAKPQEQWLERLDESGVRQRGGWLYEQLDHLKPMMRQAKQAMLQESRKHQAVQRGEGFLSWEPYELR